MLHSLVLHDNFFLGSLAGGMVQQPRDGGGNPGEDPDEAGRSPQEGESDCLLCIPAGPTSAGKRTNLLIFL